MRANIYTKNSECFRIDIGYEVCAYMCMSATIFSSFSSFILLVHALMLMMLFNIKSTRVVCFCSANTTREKKQKYQQILKKIEILYTGKWNSISFDLSASQMFVYDTLNSQLMVFISKTFVEFEIDFLANKSTTPRKRVNRA